MFDYNSKKHTFMVKYGYYAPVEEIIFKTKYGAMLPHSFMFDFGLWYRKLWRQESKPTNHDQCHFAIGRHRRQSASLTINTCYASYSIYLCPTTLITRPAIVSNPGAISKFTDETPHTAAKPRPQPHSLAAIYIRCGTHAHACHSGYK